MPIKATVCFGSGRRTCYQVVWLSWTGNLVRTQLPSLKYGDKGNVIFRRRPSAVLLRERSCIASAFQVLCCSRISLSFYTLLSRCVGHVASGALYLFALTVLSHTPPQLAGHVSECRLRFNRKGQCISMCINGHQYKKNDTCKYAGVSKSANLHPRSLGR